MNFFNLLAENVSEKFIEFTVEKLTPDPLNWIAKAISWIFNLFSDAKFGVALGVILFTVILKTVVLPLDIYSRVKSKKQSLLMERMRPEMEKLQKQYANDKAMYSQKALEIQKANGYNPLGACLPMLVSLVIFMVVFGAFSTYSNYATLMTYNNLVDKYNENVVRYEMVDENDAELEHFLLIDGESGEYRVDFDKFEAYYISVKNQKPFSSEIENDEDAKFAIVDEFVRSFAREASANWYHENKAHSSFLWIGNVWYPDSMLNKEVPSFENFSSSIARAVSETGMSSNYKESYEEVTANLSKEKQTFNGYFVLIVLAIGTMLLQQFLTMRSQKAANELSTVDGTAANTNKWMMIMMPIIFGVFSFFYSAAFSMYMIINTVYGLISMIIINKVVSVRFEKSEDRKARATIDNRKRLK